MAYLIKQGNLYVTVTKPFRQSKKEKSAKTWETQELTQRAINKLKDQGQDIKGMVIISSEKNETVLSSKDFDTLVETCKNPPPVTEVMKEAVKKHIELFEIVEEEKPQTTADVKAAFLGINSKCAACFKDCKQNFKDKIVFCPIYKETTKNG